MWAKVDDGFFDHPKARAAGRDGRALFLAGLCWSAQHLTSGHIAVTDLGLIAAKAEVKGGPTSRRLVDVGLWEPAIGGWVIHDYRDYNPSPAAVLSIREKRAEAGRKGGLRSRPPGSKSEANASANGEAFAQANGKQNGTPYPYPYYKEQKQTLEAQQIRMRENTERLMKDAEAWVPPTDEERERALAEVRAARRRATTTDEDT